MIKLLLHYIYTTGLGKITFIFFKFVEIFYLRVFLVRKNA